MRMGLGSTALSALLLASATPVIAQTVDAVRRYDVAAGPLDRALTAFAQQSGQQILYPAALVAGRQSPGLSGDYGPDAALATLLRDSGLAHRRTRPNVFVLYDPAARADLLDQEEVVELEGVVVTGTYLRGADSPSPVTVITRNDLDRSGRTTVADTLASLPQNFTGAAYEGSAGTGADRSFSNISYATGLNLRGLGADATLVLVNGRRLAGTGVAGDFADVSSIPASAVQRVDVLLDGASALYGSDAVAGVVNVILRDRFEGQESRLRVGTTSDGGADEFLFSHTAGFDWDTGSLVLSYEYLDRSEIAAEDRRSTASADLRPFGGSDWREFYSVPGNIIRFGPNGIEPVFAIPAGQPGVGLTPGDFRAGEVNLANQNEGRWFLPHQERHSLFAAGRQNLGANLSIDGELRYSDRRFDTRSYADIALLTITDANPHFVSPDGSSVSDIAYSFAKDLGPGLDEGSTESLGGSIGLNGAVGGWNLNGYVSGARETVELLSYNRVQQSFLSEALGSTPDNPATPFNTAVDGFFNPYGDPAANSRAMLDFIGSGYADTRNTSTVTSANLKADGVLFDLPGGPVRLAVGIDARREVFQPSTVNFFFGSSPPAAPTSRFERDITAAFVEARIPLIGPDNAGPGLRRLELSLAGRSERYEDIGATTNPKIGLLYEPFEDLLFRASYGESFRAPSLPELNGRYQLAPTVVSDGANNVIAIVQFGGNRDLAPETAESTTAGFVWTPSGVEGLRVEANWFRIDFNNRISQPASENINGALIDPSLAPFVTLVNPGSDAADLTLIQSLLDEPGNLLPDIFPAESYGAVIDARFVNAATLIVEGIDASVSYRFDVGGGSANLQGGFTYLDKYDRQVTPTSSFDRLLGTPQFPASWRGRAGGLWSRGRVSLGFHANYVGGSNDPVSGDEIGDWLTFDGQARVDLSSGRGPDRDLSLTLNVLNLLNEDPPFYDASRGIGFDAANTNILGRQVSLQLVKRW